MGVKRSGQFVNQCKVKLKDSMMPEIVIVDACHIMHRLCKRKMSPIINSNGDNCTSLFGTINFVLDFYKKFPQSKLIFIFDGRSPNSKKDEVVKRRDKCENASNHLNSYLINNNNKVQVLNVENHTRTCINSNVRCNNKYGKIHRNSYNPLGEIGRTKIILKSLGVSVIQAPGEADSLCAYYSRYYDSLGIDSIVITQDIDILLLGAKKIAMTKNVTSLEFYQCELSSIINLFKNKLKHMFKIDIRYVHFDIYDLHALCCLLGTESCPGLRIYKEKLSLEKLLLIYVVYDRSIKKLLTELKDNKMDVIDNLTKYGLTGIICNVTADDNYINRMLLSLDNYRNNYFIYEKYSKIIDMELNNNENNNNNIIDEEIKLLCSNLLTNDSIKYICDFSKNKVCNRFKIIPKYVKVLGDYKCLC